MPALDQHPAEGREKEVVEGQGHAGTQQGWLETDQLSSPRTPKCGLLTNEEDPFSYQLIQFGPKK